MAPRTTAAPALAACLAIAVLVCCSTVAEAAPDRRLAQSKLTCPDVKALQGNCPALCDCVKKAAPNDPAAANCEALCQGCITAATPCFGTPGAPLPAECSKYATTVASCIGGAGH